MPLAFVPQQHRLHLGVQDGILPLEARGNILMYRRFRYAESRSGLTHRRAAVDHIMCECYRSFLG